MAIIYSYPGIGTVSSSDVLPICDMSEEGFPTRSITMSQIATFVKGSSGTYGVSSLSSTDNTIAITSTGPGGTGNVDIDVYLRANNVLVGNPDKSFQAIESGSAQATGGIVIPKGTSAERPVTPAVGTIRYNTDLCVLEVYIDADDCGGATGWFTIEAAP